MLLYKYRALSNPESALDILLNQRLYCSRYSELNDPFEGLFSETIRNPIGDSAVQYPFGSFGLLVPSGERKRTKSVARSLDDLPLESRDQIRICSLSASAYDVLLWSHYAEGHNGIAIEIDVSGLEATIHEVKYINKLPQHTSYSLGYSLLNVLSLEQLLTKKTKHWKYENEYRLLCKDKYFDLQ